MLTLGEAHYLSTLPLNFSLRARRDQSYDFLTGGLTSLTEALRDGRIDCGPVAPVDYLKQPKSFELLPGLSLSSLGCSNCILLFSRKPAYELGQARIAVAHKATGAVALLRWLMREMYRLDPILVQRTGNLEQSLSEHDGVLLFQDSALMASAREGVESLHVWDLGEAWWQITNTPMLYLLWALRSDCAAERANNIKQVFAEAKCSLKQFRREVLAEAKLRTGLPTPILEGYFDRFNYEFTQAHQEGLDLYSNSIATLAR